MSYPPTSSAEVAHPKTPPLGVPWPRPPAGLFRFQPPGARSAMTRHAARRQRFTSGLHPSGADLPVALVPAISGATDQVKRPVSLKVAPSLRPHGGGDADAARTNLHTCGALLEDPDPAHDRPPALYSYAILIVPFLATRQGQGGSVECNRCPGLKRTPEHALSEDNRSGERVPETTELKAELAQGSCGQGSGSNLGFAVEQSSRLTLREFKQAWSFIHRTIRSPQDLPDRPFVRDYAGVAFLRPCSLELNSSPRSRSWVMSASPSLCGLVVTSPPRRTAPNASTSRPSTNRC